MAYSPRNPNGQATMASSAPVVIAANQSPILFRLDSFNGEVPATTAPGVAVTSLAGPLGDLLDSTGGSLNVYITNSPTVNAQSSQVGPWTIQPGNVPNTRPWLQTISQGGNSAMVTSAGALKVDPGAILQSVNNQQVGGNDIPVVAAGVSLTALAGPLGDPIDSVNNAVKVYDIGPLTDGTNAASVLPGDAGYSGLVTAAAGKTYNFSTTGNGAQNIGPFNCAGYSNVTIHITGNTTSGLAVTGQFSSAVAGPFDDANTFATASPGQPTSFINNTILGTFSTSPIVDNFLRLNVSALNSGILSGTITLSNKQIQYPSAASNQAGTWNVGINGGLMPTGTSLNTYSAQISTNTTTTPTASTAYISTIAVSVTTAGTTSTLTIKDKQGTPLTLVGAQATAALSAGDTIYNFQTPVKMTSGIDVVTAGAAAATLSIFINYFQ